MRMRIRRMLGSQAEGCFENRASSNIKADTQSGTIGTGKRTLHLATWTLSSVALTQWFQQRDGRQKAGVRRPNSTQGNEFLSPQTPYFKHIASHDILKYKTDFLKKDTAGDFPGGPVVKTACSRGRGLRFHPWSGNQTPHTTAKAQVPQLKILHAVTKTQCSQIN